MEKNSLINISTLPNLWLRNSFQPLEGFVQLLLNKSSSRGNRTANTIQIVHCKNRRHWITASTKWCKNNEVAVYDSVFKRLDVETRTTIMRMFGLKKSSEIIMMPMQEQNGSKDCGVFSIAFMTSLACEEDPSEIRYKQSDLRLHLLTCFEKGELLCFPKE